MTRHGQTREELGKLLLCSSVFVVLDAKDLMISMEMYSSCILKHAPVRPPASFSHSLFLGPTSFLHPFPFASICQHVIVHLEERMTMGNEQRQEPVLSLALEMSFLLPHFIFLVCEMGTLNQLRASLQHRHFLLNVKHCTAAKYHFCKLCSTLVRPQQ